MKNRITRWLIRILAAAACALVAFALLGERFLRVSTDRKDLKVDAVVVMAGTASEDKQRIETAIALFHQRSARYLILPMRHPTFTWSWAVDTYRLQPTVPDDRILIGRSSAADAADLAAYGGTFVEARKAAALLASHGLTSAVVVSSAYHMRRSQMAFDHLQAKPALAFTYHPVGAADPIWWARGVKIRRILDEYRKLIAAFALYPAE